MTALATAALVLAALAVLDRTAAVRLALPAALAAALLWAGAVLDARGSPAGAAFSLAGAAGLAALVPLALARPLRPGEAAAFSALLLPLAAHGLATAAGGGAGPILFGAACVFATMLLPAGPARTAGATLGIAAVAAGLGAPVPAVATAILAGVFAAARRILPGLPPGLALAGLLPSLLPVAATALRGGWTGGAAALALAAYLAGPGRR